MSKINYLLLLITFIFLSQKDASAYIDAGTGSYIIQIVLAFAIGGLYAIKLYWRKLMGYLRPSSKKEENNNEKL